MTTTLKFSHVFIAMVLLTLSSARAKSDDMIVGNSGLRVYDGVYVLGGDDQIKHPATGIWGLFVNVLPNQNRIFINHFEIPAELNLSDYLETVIQNGGFVLPQDTTFDERYYCHSYDRYCRVINSSTDGDLGSKRLIPTIAGILLPSESGQSYALVGDNSQFEASYRIRVLREVRSLNTLAKTAIATYRDIQAHEEDCVVHFRLYGPKQAEGRGYDETCLLGKVADLRASIQTVALEKSKERDLLWQTTLFYESCPGFLISAPGTTVALLDPDCVEIRRNRSLQESDRLLDLLLQFPNN